jgi:tetratricopeptide (TPR) repeat protein
VGFRKIKYCLFCFAIFAGLAGCSAEKNTSLSRTYHNLTSHYNIYFNGKESFKRGVKKAEKAFVYDYSKILPLFRYVDDNIAKQITPEMDRAIHKASKVITLHSITAKPERRKGELTEREKEFYNQSEYNKWIDDSYLLMGKAQFYKHDFIIAVNTFKFVIKEALDEDIKYEAYIWLAKAFNEMKKYRDSREILDMLENKRTFSKKNLVDLSSTYADFYLKQGDYVKAIPKLTTAVENVSQKKLHYRFAFILAQLHEEVGNYQTAYKYYSDVIKMNPPYEMTFNAKINRASSFDISQGNVDEIKKELLKMLKDEKNVDYHDQIYYTLGKISLKQQDISTAIDYIKKSANSGISNNIQKGLSFLTLADIYFQRPEYALAQAYYDSAVLMLPNDYPDYDLIVAKSKYLNDLVQQINTVELEDSLQRLSKLNDNELLALVDGIIQKINEEEQLEREKQINQQQNTMLYYQNERRFRDNVESSGGWYFYNTTALSFGRNEFKLKWGDRKLEDNWRRENKTLVSLQQTTDDDNTEEQMATDVQQNEMNKKSREYYLKNIPHNDSLIQISHQRIANALYKMGRIYQNQLKDYEQAIKTFEELNERYPENDYLLSSTYYLYELNKARSDEQMVNYYKNLIVAEFPESEFAKRLSDPDYYSKIKEQKDSIELFYENTYIKYKNGSFAEVINDCDYASTKFKEHELVPKFMLLKALSIGKTSNIRTFKNSLDEIVVNYPESEVVDMAKGITAYLNQSHPILKEEEEEVQARVIYSFEENKPHYFVLVVEKDKVNINQLLFNIISFNIDQYTSEDFITEGEMLDEIHQIITVKSFPEEKAAMEYYTKIKSDLKILSELENTHYDFFIISDTNLNTLLNDKSVSKYLKFFKKQYLR